MLFIVFLLLELVIHGPPPQVRCGLKCRHVLFEVLPECLRARRFVSEVTLSDSFQVSEYDNPATAV